jgi:uncharacterized SAM-binding protein YcdF (DUF218 family)
MMALLKVLLMPLPWILLLLIAGLILSRPSQNKRRIKTSRYMILTGTLILFVLSLLPVSNLIVYSLEGKYIPVSDETLSSLDIVVILDGGLNAVGSYKDNPEPSGNTYSRLLNGVRFFKQSRAGTMALCGGVSQPGTQSAAEVMKKIAMEMGVPESEIVIETKSRNTMENASELVRIMPKEQGRRIGLVTSTLHIRRATKAFNKYFPDDTIVPLPVNHQYNPVPFDIVIAVPSAGVLASSSQALREWIALLWYSIRC